MRLDAAVAPLQVSQTRASASRPPVTAFVFSGGTSLGALQVGMLRALYERGIVADMLIGTSAGAFNAAFVASRPQTVDSAIELAGVWRGLHREDVFPVCISALVGGLCGQRDHLVPDRALRRLVRRCVEFDDLAAAATPLHVLAFDLIEGCEVLLSDGPAVDIICAATSIPGVFPPVAIGERRLIHGGVVGDTPISSACELGAERIYVLPTHHGSRPLRPAPRGALDVAIYALSLLVEGGLEADIARCAHEVEVIVLPVPSPVTVQPSEFAYASELIGEALTAAREALGPSRGLPVATTSADRRGLRIA